MLDHEREAVAELQIGRDAPVATAETPFPAVFLASAVGNQTMSRLASRRAASEGRAGAEAPLSGPYTTFLTSGLELARKEHRPEAAMLSRALRTLSRNPNLAVVEPLSRTELSTPTLSRCSCGGMTLPGGECTQCLAGRLRGGGMPEAAVQRTVLARAMLARQDQPQSQESIMGCLNRNLASHGVPAWILAILGGVCGILGALGGSAAAPGPGTAAGGVSAAAVCIAGVTGLSIGWVMGTLINCMRGGDTVVAEAPTGAGAGPGGAGAPTAVA